MKYTVITTFNLSGYKQYGQRMIQTWLATWPQEVDLVVYAEGCEVAESATNLRVIDIAQVCALTEFKNRWRGVPHANGDVSADPVRGRRRDAGKGFKWDAVRFAHKVYSIFHCAQNTNADCLIWMDGDTVCHSPISLQQLQQLCPDTVDLGFLGRRGKFSECGLYSMNLRSAKVRDFLAEFQRMYDEAEQGIFTLDEWHDSYVFDVVRHRVRMIEQDWSSHLITGEGHPLINSAWGAYLDHLKGARKNTGRSAVSDLRVRRTEAYWQ